MEPAPRIVATALILACVSASAATAPTRSLLDGMNRSLVPGNDFYAYANGEWLSSTEIPADRSSYGPSAQLANLNEQRVADLIRASAASNPAAGSEARKVTDYYAAFPDEATIESRGLGVLKPTMDQIAAINNRTSLRQQIVTDGHAPSQYRGVTLRNLDAWYSAFDVKPGQGLYRSPAERVRMW
jgi:putative endopeptidase